MRTTLTLLALTVLALPAAAQRPGGPGQGPPLPDHWVPFDSLTQAVQLTETQQAAARALHTQIDSIVRRGAAVRTEMRDEMQRSRDREQMQRYIQRLTTMQQRVDRLLNDLRAGLTEEQKTALDAVRGPMVMPPRPQGQRGRN